MPKKLLSAHQDYMRKLKKSNASLKVNTITVRMFNFITFIHFLDIDTVTYLFIQRKADSTSISKSKKLKTNGKQARKVDKVKGKDRKVKKSPKQDRKKNDKIKKEKKDKAARKDKNKINKKEKKGILMTRFKILLPYTYLQYNNTKEYFARNIS